MPGRVGLRVRVEAGSHLETVEEPLVVTDDGSRALVRRQRLEALARVSQILKSLLGGPRGAGMLWVYPADRCPDPGVDSVGVKPRRLGLYR